MAEAYRFAYRVGDDTAPGTVRNNGYKVLNHPRVAARVRELQEAAGARSVQSTAYLIRELEEMVSADLNELMQLVVGACRHCYGHSHRYQWRDADEYLDACVRALDASENPPNDAGGYGYKFDREPHPECDHCQGSGVQRVRFTNTADLSPGVRRLFKGIELFPDGGIKRVLLHDQMQARIELHKLRGMHIDRSVSLTAHVAVPALKDMSRSEALDFLESLRPTQAALPVHVEAAEPQDATP